MTVGALANDELLLILKIGFLVLLYGFILLVVRSATKDLGGAPQESIVLGAAEAARLRAEHGVRAARFVLLEGPGQTPGAIVDLNGSTIVGRDAESGLRLDGDEFASARHARLDPRPDGVWIEDLGSTNGTFVNGGKITTPRLLRAGDAVRIGQTELRYER